MNPYDFIPLGRPSVRKPPPGHHLLAERGGTVHARLTTLGPFLIAQQSSTQNTIMPLRRGAIIPGSSLKGMLRSLAEMVGGGCISMSGSLYPREKYDYAAFADQPRGFDPCADPQALCVTCRMFGALIRGQAWKGLIEPGEAKWSGNGGPKTTSYNVVVGQPKPNHHAFYVKDRKIRGRKAYYHHADRNKIIQSASAQHATYGARQTILVHALEPGQVYDFSVRHEGLDAYAYALLLYALFQEDGLAHKLGWGKPMGFGSVKIEPIAIEEIDLHARYRRGGDRATAKHEGAAAAAHVREKTSALRADRGEVMEAVRRMFAYPGPPANWAYPTYSWFKGNPAVPLEDFNRRASEGR